MRGYLPLTWTALAQAHAAGVVAGELEPVLAEDDSEEAEYAALMTAADASAALPDGSHGRVVLAVEVPFGSAVAGGIPASSWAAVHVDLAAGADPDDDLAWFAIQEIPTLIEEMAPGR